MSFLLWQTAALDEADRSALHLASTRRVFGAAEVPLLRDAATLMQQVHERAQAQAQALDTAVQSARRQGHAEGHAQGLEAARNEVAQRLLALDSNARARADELRGQVAVLALAAARKMLGELPFADALVAASAQAARDVLPDQRVTLHVHPSRVAEVRAALSRSTTNPQLTTAALPDVQPDALLGTDDGRLETPHGNIQVGLETQLARLAQAWGVPNAAGVGTSNAAGVGTSNAASVGTSSAASVKSSSAMVDDDATAGART